MKVLKHSVTRLSVTCFALMLSAGLASADQVATPGEYDLEGTLSDGHNVKVNLKVRSAFGRPATFDREFMLFGFNGESVGSNSIRWEGSAQQIGSTYWVLYMTRPGLTALPGDQLQLVEEGPHPAGGMTGALGTDTGALGTVAGADTGGPVAQPTAATNMILGEYAFSDDGTVTEKLTNLTRKFPEDYWSESQAFGVRSSDRPSQELLGELHYYENSINNGFAKIQAELREHGTDPNAEFDLAVETKSVPGVPAVMNELLLTKIEATGRAASAQLVNDLRDRATKAPFNWIAVGSNKPLLELALLIEQQTGPHRDWAAITLISGLTKVHPRKPVDVLVLEDANGDYVATFVTGSALSD